MSEKKKRKSRPIIGNEYIDFGDYYEIVINSKTHGEHRAKISKEDYDLCRKYTWGISRCYIRKTLFYAYTYWDGIKSINQSLHRLISGNPPKGLDVDHINHDTMDNRRENLRVVSHKVNLGNQRGPRKNNKLGILNIQYFEKQDKYRVFVNRRHVCMCDTLEEAKVEAEKARRKAWPELYQD